ncbi:MAG: N-acetylneuraminate synthase, partial [Planctomycetes bacterium]|nr:N-acetylneuraminate synthase [Planctomycetota bacterium]
MMTMREAERSCSTLVVAEIAQAHDGSLGILLSMVEAAAACGVDAVKFQVHIAHAESGPEEPFRIPFSPVDRTRFEYWRRMELSPQAWKVVQSRCVELGIEFIATPFSCAAVDLLRDLGVRHIKIGSGDASNPLLL